MSKQRDCCVDLGQIQLLFEARQRRRLNEAIRAEVLWCCQNDKRVDVEKVGKRVYELHSVLIRENHEALSHAQVRILIQHALRALADAAPDVLDDDAVPELDLPGIEEFFRGIPRMVAYEDRPGHRVYIEYRIDSLREERRKMLFLKDRSIQADVRRRQPLAAGNEFLDSLANTYGDLPAGELLKRWREDQRHRSGARA
jgi:hypothetical protein